MPARISDDRFDEVRRAWIAAHQDWSTIQRRRAELLGRKVRARQRAVAAAVPDPHDDMAIPPLWLRSTKSAGSQVEMLAAVLVAILTPIGWLAGWLLKMLVARLVPDTLRAYPIPALLWAGALLGLSVVLFYNPEPTLRQIVVSPWVCAQVAAAPFIAGVYGIADGWLAVTGSDQWWPLTPPKRPMTAEDASLILGPYDSTGPGLLDAQPLPEPGERSQSW